jgi:uncharacterized protein YbaA (DUF1428 family)
MTYVDGFVAAVPTANHKLSRPMPKRLPSFSRNTAH